MLLLAALAFTAVLGTALLCIGETIAAAQPKIIAALRGHSMLSEPVLATRPVTVRMVSRRVSRPLSVRPQLRAAA